MVPDTQRTPVRIDVSVVVVVVVADSYRTPVLIDVSVGVVVVV